MNQYNFGQAISESMWLSIGKGHTQKFEEGVLGAIGVGRNKITKDVGKAGLETDFK